MKMFGNKKYKKGMEDAAKAYKVFGEKQEAALKYILTEVREGKSTLEEALKKLGDIDANIGDLYSYLKSKEKAELYTIYTPYDIANLGKEEKLFLGGALLRLTMDKMPTEEQQAFMRSILHYLDIKEPPFGIELSAIDYIYGMSAQAIYQVILEYLILQDGDSYDETELQQEFLERFQLNPKTKAAIAEHVETLYVATGAEGLAEKYGYVVEEDQENASKDNDKIDSSEEEKRLEKEAVSFLLNDGKNSIFSNKISLKDYFYYDTNGFFLADSICSSTGVLFNKKLLTKELVDWLPPKINPDSSVVYENLCCTVVVEDFVTRNIAKDIYIINFDKKQCCSLNIKNLPDSVELKAMNDEWLIMDVPDNSVSKTLFQDNPNQYTLLYNFNTKTTETLPVRCDAAYFSGNNIYIDILDKIYKYDITTKKIDEIFDICETIADIKEAFSYKGSCVDKLIYKNKLYILGKDLVGSSDYCVDRHYIYSVSLDDTSMYEKVADNIYIYKDHLSICKYESGWIFITEDEQRFYYDAKFYLTAFSCKTNEKTKIAKGCGKVSEFKTGILKNKTEYYRQTFCFFKWNNSVFFQQDAGYILKAPACVNINEPMNIIVAE